MFLNLDAPCVTPVHLGQELVLFPLGNYAARGTVNRPQKGTVTKIGRKYFYIDDKPFDIKTGLYADLKEYNGSYLLFPSMAAYRNAVETAWEKEQLRKLSDTSVILTRNAIPADTFNSISKLLHGCGALWVCTDTDCMQFRRTLNKERRVFELYQVFEAPDEKFFIAHDVVHLCDLSESDQRSLIVAYGWDMETIQSDDFPGLLAEAVFESSASSFICEGKGFSSFEKAAMEVCRRVGVSPSLYL